MSGSSNYYSGKGGSQAKKYKERQCPHGIQGLSLLQRPLFISHIKAKVSCELLYLTDVVKLCEVQYANEVTYITTVQS